MYCFENAPGLVGVKGEMVRFELENIARNAGYSVLYYKTDTKYHHNCQRRPRTFVVFTKWRDGQQTPPLFDYEHDTMLVPEFFSTISESAPQQEPVKSSIHNYVALDFMKQKYGEDKWLDALKIYNIITHIITYEIDDFRKFIDECDYSEKDKEKTLKYINHIL